MGALTQKVADVLGKGFFLQMASCHVDKKTYGVDYTTFITYAGW